MNAIEWYRQKRAWGYDHAAASRSVFHWFSEDEASKAIKSGQHRA